MLSHIYHRDWCATRSPKLPFVDEVDIDNNVVEKILRNKFWDPMISSDEDEPREQINWSTVFKKKITQELKFNNFVPGCRKPPPHPKLSSLTKDEQYRMLKVLCSKSNVLPKLFLGKVTKGDLQLYEEKKDAYMKEQKEYLEWAKNLWISTNCIKALRPNETIQTVYKAELKMKAHMLQCFPKNYTLAAQIPLKSEKYICEILMPKSAIHEVNISDLPEVSYPPLTQKCSILQDIAAPEPCTQHPCKFTLPNETIESLLPLTEVHNELAQYALDNGAEYIASESAIKCLLEIDRSWTIPVSVCQVIDQDGERSNVVVLDNEFPLKKDVAPTRTYKAYRHLLQKAFTAKPSIARPVSDSSVRSHGMCLRTKNRVSRPGVGRMNTRSGGRGAPGAAMRRLFHEPDDSEDSDDNRLLIDFRGETPKPEEATQKPQLKESLEDTKETGQEHDNKRKASDLGSSPPKKRKLQTPDVIQLYDCVCKDTEFESPKHRSYRNVQLKNITTKEIINVIIHCSHKLKNERSNEVILEPIIEYQLEIGGTTQSPHKLQSLAFSLMMRKNASLINVRVDASTGELVTVDTLGAGELARGADVRPAAANTLHTALAQLAGLLPGQYLLLHEPSHGDNAILYTSRAGGGAEVTMQFEEHGDAEKARHVQAVPSLGPVLLPNHKHRRILPLAFTYDSRLVSLSTKPATRVKPPPPAMLWPKKGKKKRKKKKKKKNNNNSNDNDSDD